MLLCKFYNQYVKKIFLHLNSHINYINRKWAELIEINELYNKQKSYISKEYRNSRKNAIDGIGRKQINYQRRREKETSQIYNKE